MHMCCESLQIPSQAELHGSAKPAQQLIPVTALGSDASKNLGKEEDIYEDRNIQRAVRCGVGRETKAEGLVWIPALARSLSFVYLLTAGI